MKSEVLLSELFAKHMFFIWILSL